jgi:hypothetical protein
MNSHPQLKRKIPYSKLNSRQKENYNFQKISSILADYGFTTIRLSDDWNGADFLALHIDGRTVLRIQLKGRMQIHEKCLRKQIWIAFADNDRNWYLWPHDTVFRNLMRRKNIKNTRAFKSGRGWSYSRLPRDVADFLQPFKLK